MKHEEAMKLKPGTPVIIRSKVVSVDASGDIVYETHAHDQEHEIMHARTDCQYADLQTPKHDPYRWFKKGDKVQPRKVNGRCPFGVDITDSKPRHMDFGATVQEDEDQYGMVRVNTLRGDIKIHSYFLELITPIEDLLPYSVEAHEEGECGCFEVMQGKQCVSIYPYGTHETRYYKKSEQAKEAAEAECERLNEEWRKNKNNA